MSGLLKSVGKVFKKVVKSKVFKIAMIAAAVYFTAGIGLAASGSAFAATLPGISGAAGLLGVDISAGLAAAGGAAATAGGAALGAVADVTAGGAFGGAADAVGGAFAGGAGSAATAGGGIVESAMQAGGEDFASFNGAQQAANPVSKAATTASNYVDPVKQGAKTAAKALMPGDQPGTEEGGISKWMQSDGAKNILAQSIVGGAKAYAGMEAAKAASDDRQKDRDIRANNSRVPTFTPGSFRPGYQNISTNSSGIVNSAKGG